MVAICARHWGDGYLCTVADIAEVLRQYSRTVPLLGEWHSYHWSRTSNGKPVFRHENGCFGFPGVH